MTKKVIPVKSFFKLDNANLFDLEDDVGLDSRLLEIEMKKYNGGLDLFLFHRKQVDDDSMYRSFVPFFYDAKAVPNKKRILNLVNKYPDLYGPNSMKVSSLEELSNHMSVAYQISHFHYLLENFEKIGF